MPLQVENLYVSYGKTIALSGVSINVDDGKIVSIIGANGAGKTTLLNSISAVVPRQQGNITYNGIPLAKKDYKVVKQGIVQVPEGRKIFSGLTVRENLMMGAYLTKSSSEKNRMIGEMFELFPRLSERQNQHGATLSGGEQQMLAVARGLMSKPKLLLLDEPSLGLAPLIVDALFEAIRNIRDKGITVMLVEQNAIKALELCDYCYVLKNGKIDLEGTGEQMLANEQLIQAFLGSKKGSL